MRKIYLMLFLIAFTCFNTSAQSKRFGGSSTAAPAPPAAPTPQYDEGVVYYQVSSATAPVKPSATSYNFSTKSFSSLSKNWLPSAPAGLTKYWTAKYSVNETSAGSGTGSPIFQTPLSTLAGSTPPPIVPPGPVPDTTVKGTVRDFTKDGGELEKKVPKSLRGEYATDNYKLNDSIKAFNKKVLALDYEYLREDDWLFSEFIWRDIDAREKFNQTFMYEGEDNSGDQRFLSILINSIKNDSVWAFTNDRFTNRKYFEDIISTINGPKKMRVDDEDPDRPGVKVRDTVYTFDKNKGLKVDSIYTFRLKEQWIFDKESSRLYSRIIGICPVATITETDKVTKKKTQSQQELFWIYYPDLRNILSVKKVYNPNSYAGRGTWDALFEDRRYTGRIVKTSYDNPKNKYIQELIITNPLFRLLEGENIKTRIFNYEQSLWSY
jgi:gliding motility associated protien GldN